MPYMCCVPKCRGNYNHGPKVHVFGFPNDEELKQKWITAIRRENFVPSKTSKVCELHFHSHEIEKHGSVFDRKSGKTVPYKLKYPRLIPEAIPSQFPNCPMYLSASKPCVRLSRDEKLNRKEQGDMVQAIERSKKEFIAKQELDVCETLQDIKEKVCLKEPWKKMENVDNFTLYTTNASTESGPCVDVAVCVDSDLLLNVFFRSVKLQTLGDHRFPLKANSASKIDSICDAVLSVNSTEANTTATSGVVLRLQLILSLLLPLIDDKFKYSSVIQFVYEQLHLMTKTRMNYSHDYIIFAALFYNVSPHAYRFLRQSGS